MNPSRAGEPSGNQNPHRTGSGRNPNADPHSHARTQGFNPVGQRPTQTYPGAGGPSDAWYYGPGSQDASHSQVTRALSAAYQAAGPPTHHEEAYARSQYQQWPQSFPAGSQQQPAPFAAQPPGGTTYHHGQYMNQPGGSYNRPPDNPVDVGQGAFAQQFSTPTAHQDQSSVNSAYSELYGLVVSSTGHPSTQPYRRSQNVQVSGHYGGLPQQRSVEERQHLQQETPSYTTYAQKRHPSTDSTLSNSPGSWPNEVLDPPPSAGVTGFQFKMQKPTSRASENQYPTQAHLPVPGPTGASAIKESNSAPPSIGGERKRKRVKRGEDTDAEDGDSPGESEEDDPSFAGGISVGVTGLGVVRSGKGRSRHSRLPGACKHCKKLKMKCEFPKGDQSTCVRCRSTGYACIVEGRKPRNAPK